MITEEINAWILHKKPLGETSAYVTFFTREKGILCALCRGVKTLKNSSIMQQFNPLWVSIAERANHYYVNKVELIASSLSLEKYNLYACLYLNELIYYLLKPLDAYDRLYDLYVNTLYGLQDAKNKTSIEILLRCFEWELLIATGYGVSLTHDANTGITIKDDTRYNFIPGLGLIESTDGILGKYLYKVANNIFDEEKTLKVSKFIMRKALDYCLNGREIKARSLLFVN